MKKFEKISKKFFEKIGTVEIKKNTILYNYEINLFEYGRSIVEIGKNNEEDEKMLVIMSENKKKIFDLDSVQFSLLKEYTENLLKNEILSDQMKDAFFDKAKQSMLTYDSSKMTGIMDIEYLESYQGDDELKNFASSEQFDEDYFESLGFKKAESKLSEEEYDNLINESKLLRKYLTAYASPKIFPNTEVFEDESVNYMQYLIKNEVARIKKGDMSEVESLTYVLTTNDLRIKRAKEYAETVEFIYRQDEDGNYIQGVASAPLGVFKSRPFRTENRTPTHGNGAMAATRLENFAHNNFQEQKDNEENEARESNECSGSSHSSPIASGSKIRPIALEAKKNKLGTLNDFFRDQK